MLNFMKVWTFSNILHTSSWHNHIKIILLNMGEYFVKQFGIYQSFKPIKFTTNHLELRNVWWNFLTKFSLVTHDSLFLLCFQNFSKITFYLFILRIWNLSWRKMIRGEMREAVYVWHTGCLLNISDWLGLEKTIFIKEASDAVSVQF